MNKQTLIEDLNGDLAGLLGSIIQHITYAAKTSGRHRQRIKRLFLDGLPQEEAHARFLAQKIVLLGGEPTTVSRGVHHAVTNREMVEALGVTQRQAIHDFAQRVKHAEECGDVLLAGALEDMMRNERTQLARTERILEDWPQQTG